MTDLNKLFFGTPCNITLALAVQAELGETVSLQEDLSSTTLPVHS